MKTDVHDDRTAIIVTASLKCSGKRGFIMPYLSFSWQVLLELQLDRWGTAKPPNLSPRSSNKEDHCGKKMV